MSKREFIQVNKEAIDNFIKSQVGQSFLINNREREMWVLNDERLYRWAKSVGVRI